MNERYIVKLNFDVTQRGHVQLMSQFICMPVMSILFHSVFWPDL